MILFRNIDRFINNLILAIYLLINLHFMLNIIINFINSFNTNLFNTNLFNTNITDLKIHNIKWGLSPVIPIELIKNININNSLFRSKLFQEVYIIKN